jgi:hypothetical protein
MLTRQITTCLNLTLPQRAQSNPIKIKLEAAVRVNPKKTIAKIHPKNKQKTELEQVNAQLVNSYSKNTQETEEIEIRTTTSTPRGVITSKNPINI